MAVEDLQSGWLLLIVVQHGRFFGCGQSDQDASDWQCMVQLMSVDWLEMSQKLASLPFRLGNMGLANAVRGREAAQWASWANCIKMVKHRHPPIAATIREVGSCLRC